MNVKKILIYIVIIILIFGSGFGSGIYTSNRQHRTELTDFRESIDNLQRQNIILSDKNKDLKNCYSEIRKQLEFEKQRITEIKNIVSGLSTDGSELSEGIRGAIETLHRIREDFAKIRIILEN